MAMTAAAAAPAAAVTLPREGGAFCADRVVRDYERALDGLPPSRRPPGELPFGPRNLSLYTLNFGARVVLAPGHVGYRFAWKDAGRRTLRLGWRVTASAQEVNRRGRPVGEPRTLRRRLATVEKLDDLKFGFAAEPGIVRIGITVTGPRRGASASFHEYVRVLPRRSRLRVVANRAAYRPGETVHARAVNVGTNVFRLKPRLELERRGPGGWLPLASPPVPDPENRRYRWVLLGGEASPCARYRVPPDAPPGRYRFVATGSPFGEFEWRAFAAGFRVIAGA